MALQAQPTFQIQPSSTKIILPSNYTSLYDYTSQYLPDTNNDLVNIFGNQSITGMLQYLSAEYASNADQYIWAEEGRLHTAYNDVTRSGSTFTKVNHVYRVNEVIHISDGTTKVLAVITAVPDLDTFTVSSYKTTGLSSLATSALTTFIAGSEFRKGTFGMQESLDTDITIRRNKPVIMKEVQETSGSDATNVSWITTKDGGFLWYLRSEKDARRRYEDRLEIQLLLGQSSEAGSGAELGGFQGTEGLFESVETRGNVFSGIASTISEWDDVVRRFDKQGAIQDYMFYCDRDQSLAIDGMLGELNAGYSGGVSYGIFENSEEMSVNLGFRGFKRGSYNFFKSDWKVLNDPTLLGAVATTAGKVRGLLVPVGTTDVYDGAGKDYEKMKMPFLHLKYKAAGGISRRYETWVTGSVGGVRTDDKDSMSVHQRSERGLCTLGANNFMIFLG